VGLLEKNVIILVGELIVMALGSITGRDGIILEMPYVTGQYDGLGEKLSKAGVVFATS
jgi:hypothetical protein